MSLGKDKCRKYSFLNRMCLAIITFVHAAGLIQSTYLIIYFCRRVFTLSVEFYEAL